MRCSVLTETSIFGNIDKGIFEGERVRERDRDRQTEQETARQKK